MSICTYMLPESVQQCNTSKDIGLQDLLESILHP